MTDCCDECGKTEGKLRLCTRCRLVRYCSTDCQRKAWTGGHKDRCGSAAPATTASSSSSKVPPPLSDETRRALMELQGKIHSIQSSMRQTDAQLAAYQKQMGSAKVTESALRQFPDDAKMFEAVGRAYLRAPRDDVFRNLDEAAETAESKIKKLKDNKEYLIKSMGEAEEQARELTSRG